MFSPDETIAALASAAGGAARGIVRLSGPDVRGCLNRCFAPDDRAAWAAALRPAMFPGSITLAGSGARLECDVYLWPGARSYTRQPLAEVHMLGSPPLLEAVLATLGTCGARPARPGEFTLRAFLAGRLDLTQAEAVLGVIDAADSRQLADALEQLAGGLAGPLHALRGELLDLLAHLEAGLDFADEGIQFITAEELGTQLARAAGQVAALQERMSGRTHVGESVRIVLVGAPNVGKSTLFNALAGRDAALVSPQAGTTRDYLVAPLAIGGMHFELIDTAGRDPRQADTISTAAANAASRQANQADIQLFCLDATRPLSDWEREQLAQGQLGCSGATSTRLIVWTKADVQWEGEAPAEPGSLVGPAQREGEAPAEPGLLVRPAQREGEAPAEPGLLVRPAQWEGETPAEPGSLVGPAQWEGEAPAEPGSLVGPAQWEGEAPAEPGSLVGPAQREGEAPAEPGSLVGPAQWEGEAPAEPGSLVGPAQWEGEAPAEPGSLVGPAQWEGEAPAEPGSLVGPAQWEGEAPAEPGSLVGPAQWEGEAPAEPGSLVGPAQWEGEAPAEPGSLVGPAQWEGEAPAEPGSLVGPARQEPRPPGDRLAVSALTGAGLDLLRERLRSLLAEIQSPECRVVAGTAVRSRASLAAAAEALSEARQLAAASSGEELVAAELRLALDALGDVVGAVYTDDILDRIFSRFCIGK